MTLSCTTPYGPFHHAEFKKKLVSQSQENFHMEGLEDRRTEGQTDHNDRTLSATAGGGPKKTLTKFLYQNKKISKTIVKKLHSASIKTLLAMLMHQSLF